MGVEVDVGPPKEPRLIFKMPVLDASSNATMPKRQTSPSPAIANNVRFDLCAFVSKSRASGTAAPADTPGGCDSTQSFPS